MTRDRDYDSQNALRLDVASTKECLLQLPEIQRLVKDVPCGCS
ncbi:hypothetical protein [Corynebacterium vitaeruminis]